MKNMMNWDLYTHPKAKEFAKKTPNPEKIRLAEAGKDLWKKKIFIFLSMNGIIAD
jgi:hypothetical protein